MAVRPIAQIGAPVLRQRAREVTRAELASPELQALIDDLIDTMHDARGAGLAAPQVSAPVRVVVIEVPADPPHPYRPPIPLTVLVNPVLTPVDDERFDHAEGCLSVPVLRGRVPRAARVRVQAWDRHGAAIDEIAVGLTAATYQHEVDHLDGVLFVDRADPRTLATLAEFERHQLPEVIAQARALVARLGGEPR